MVGDIFEGVEYCRNDEEIANAVRCSIGTVFVYETNFTEMSRTIQVTTQRKKPFGDGDNREIPVHVGDDLWVTFDGLFDTKTTKKGDREYKITTDEKKWQLTCVDRDGVATGREVPRWLQSQWDVTIDRIVANHAYVPRDE